MSHVHAHVESGESLRPVPTCDCSGVVEQLEADLADSRRQIENLSIALQSSREIGTALGIVMGQHRLTSDQAFAVLRIVSQRNHRKVRDLAAEIAFTGTVDIPQLAQVLKLARIWSARGDSPSA